MLLFEPQEKRHLIGVSAHREISSRLWGYPAAQRLSREVYDFYGDYLSYTESRNFASSTFSINLQHEPIALTSAEIRLRVGTDRVAESLAHELLHLCLPMLGFPLGELVWIPLQLDPYARDFLRMSQWVLNLVQHEVSFQSFIALGFEKKYFLSKHLRPMDYRKLFNRQAQNGYVEEVDFPRWCIAYLGHFFTARHGRDEECMHYAQDALDWGSRLHPELKRVIFAINRWLEKGAFKDPCQYPREVNALLELMRIPKYTGWVILELSEPQKPVAVRLENMGVCSDGPDKANSFLPSY